MGYMFGVVLLLFTEKCIEQEGAVWLKHLFCNTVNKEMNPGNCIPAYILFRDFLEHHAQFWTCPFCYEIQQNKMGMFPEGIKKNILTWDFIFKIREIILIWEILQRQKKHDKKKTPKNQEQKLKRFSSKFLTSPVKQGIVHQTFGVLVLLSFQASESTSH